MTRGRVYKTRPALLVLIVCLVATPALAQRGLGDAPTPRAAAPIDLTGYWVSLVTDDWRWRMVTPPKGDILYLPVNDEGRRVADAWDPAKDDTAGEACRAATPSTVVTETVRASRRLMRTLISGRSRHT